MDTRVQPRRLARRDRWQVMTTGLAWDTTFQPREAVFPHERLEGIRIHDWNGFRDPLHQTVDAYWKTQAEKERRVYALIDAFGQTNGHLGVSDVRYVNAPKLLLQAYAPMHGVAHRGFAHLARQFGGEALRTACLFEAADELRAAQAQVHTASLYNKYFNGLHDAPHWFDRAWYLAPSKSFAEAAATAGPFELLVAWSLVFEGLFGPLFAPFMSGAAFNGDLSTATAGFSTQGDASRHAAAGLAATRFVLEQDAANLPQVQRWIDTWFWRTFRVMTPLALMQDYMLPKRTSSWKQNWEQAIEQQGAALFADLAPLGLRKPAGWSDACAAKDHLSHQAWSAFYGWSERTAFHTWAPGEPEQRWLARRYPDSFNRWYRPRLEHYAQRAAQGQRFHNRHRPLTCAACRWPMIFTEPNSPRWIAYRESTFDARVFHTCSDACRDTFEQDPQRHAQAHDLAAAASEGDAGFVAGRDNLDIVGSQDALHFAEWGAGQNPKEGQL